MAILVSGDVHGEHDSAKLNNPNVKSMNNDEFPSHLIVAGDFGFIWSNNPQDKAELHWKKWFDEKPYETLVVLGNHENYTRIYALPVVQRYGGPMYQWSEKVFIFQHGNIYTVEGKTFFIFGGALSIDKHMRRNEISWWAAEIPTTADVLRGLASLDSVKGKVDYVITHTVPKEAIDTLGQRGLLLSNAKFDDPTVPMLEALREKLDPESPKEWIAGHFHCDTVVGGETTRRRYRILYQQLFRIE